jgi:glycine hydroxymethyltransferase
VNKNAVPNDPRPPMVTSGLRMGTPAITTRGFREAEVEQVSHWIADVLAEPTAEATLKRVQRAVIDLCHRFPVYA